MSERYDCTDPSGRTDGVPAAAGAIRRGEVIVLPTDTVYGIGCDAFDATAVASVLAAKGRGRDMPPPVLIPTARTAQGLATQVPDYAQRLMEKFWPGPLTVVLRAQTSLHWDLGDTNGTVALRVPDHDLTLELLGDVGPMAVTSANTTGDPAARTVDEAMAMLGESVSVYLDAGPSGDGEASTIIDCTGEAPVTLRIGAIAQEDIDAALLPPDDVVSDEDSEEDTLGEWHDVSTDDAEVTATGTDADADAASIDAEVAAAETEAAGTESVGETATGGPADDTLGEWHDVSSDERRTDGVTPTQ
ncbi:L-threonylcarbamoyladenylate synthase [Humibacillus xanthopallidus]|uniref:L-threonylcarbamoyladenylate synthase n=1 Tax=Humibacillus xanthopallidus TaxID=412689 RepID=UPI00384F17DD